MVFVKTFKRYEDKTRDLDVAVNAWIQQHQANVVSIQTVLSHEPGAGRDPAICSIRLSIRVTRPWTESV